MKKFIIFLIVSLSCTNSLLQAQDLLPQEFSVNLYKEYTSLKSRELEELPRFQVMSWQPF